MVPSELSSRWTVQVKHGQRALQALVGGASFAASHRLVLEAAAELQQVVDELRQSELRSSAAGLALVEAWSNEASLRHVLALQLAPQNAAASLAAWKLQPFIDAAEQVL
jgi:hypothetical protein